MLALIIGKRTTKTHRRAFLVALGLIGAALLMATASFLRPPSRCSAP